MRGDPLYTLRIHFFCHVQGAFTGATEDHKGYFETANRGTLFLDEIGDMLIENQIKLLRVLDDGVITPIGATVNKKVDVRVIAATNADIPAKIEAGLFRSDLYNRLAGMTIGIPPLRERTADILPLAEYYLSAFAGQMGVPPPSLTPEAVAALETYLFPGNVRELIHIIERAVIISDGTAIHPKHLRFQAPHTNVLTPPVTGIDEAGPLNAADSVLHLASETDISEGPFLPLREALVRYERQYLCQALEWTGGNRARSGASTEYPPAHFLPKISQVQFMN